MIWLLAACETLPRAHQLIPDVASNGGVVRCAALENERLRLDCAMAGAPVDPLGVPGVCNTLSGALADECWFITAEYSLDPSHCTRSGTFARQCALHVLVNPKLGVVVGPADEVEARAAEAIPQFGLEVDDAQAWEWISAHGSRQQGLLDRGWCEDFSDVRRAPCRDAVDFIFERDLRKLAARKMVGCDGELPAALTVAPAPEFDTILEQVREEGLCVENPRTSHGEGPSRGAPFR